MTINTNNKKDNGLKEHVSESIMQLDSGASPKSEERRLCSQEDTSAMAGDNSSDSGLVIVLISSSVKYVK